MCDLFYLHPQQLESSNKVQIDVILAGALKK